MIASTNLTISAYSASKPWLVNALGQVNEVQRGGQSLFLLAGQSTKRGQKLGGLS